MKKAFTNIILTLTIVLNSQVVPQAFNYQGIARDASGNSLSAKQLGVRITLQEKNGNTTTDVYSETHSVTTNIFGLFNIPIGRGISSLGNFSTVNFANKNITVRTEIDPNGGSNYTLNGNSELLSVPYALVAGNAGNSTNYWNKNIVNNFLYVNTNEKIGIGTDAPNATLDLVGTAKFGTLTSSTTNTKLLTADASGNLAFRDLSTISTLNQIWTKNSSNNTVYTNNNEKVGINVIPEEALHVNLNGGSARFDCGPSNAPQDEYERLILGFKNKLGISFLPFSKTGTWFHIHHTIEESLQFSSGNYPGQYPLLTLKTDGSLGIGTSSPNATLDLVGTAKFGTLATSTTNTKLLTADASGNLAFRDLSTISTLSSTWTKNSSNNTIYVNNGEKIGIGTNSPQHYLDIIAKESTGAARNLLWVENQDNSGTSSCVSLFMSGTDSNRGLLAINAYAKTYLPSYMPELSGSGMISSDQLVLISNSTSGHLAFRTGKQADEGKFTGFERMRITYDGKIGIGTPTPSATLDLVGTAKFGTLASSTTNTKLLTADASGNLAFRDLSTIPTSNSIWTKNSSDNTIYVNNNEKVGINVIPEEAFHVNLKEGVARFDCGVGNTPQNLSDVINIGLFNKLAISFRPMSSPKPWFHIHHVIDQGAFQISSGGSPGETPHITIKNNGNIGMGTANPSATLDLVGTAKFGTLSTSTTNTKLLTADASGNLAFRDLSSIAGTFNGGMMEVITGAENPKTVIVNAGLHVNDGRARLGYTNTYSDVNATDILFNAWKNQDYKPQRLTSGYIAGISFGHGFNSLGDFGGGISIFSSPVGPAGEVVNTTNSLMYLKNNGNIGLSTQEPKSKLHISQGDVYIDDATKGIIMKSPNGQCWRVTVSNTGGFTSTSITCP